MSARNTGAPHGRKPGARFDPADFGGGGSGVAGKNGAAVFTSGAPGKNGAAVSTSGGLTDFTVRECVEGDYIFVDLDTEARQSCAAAIAKPLRRPLRRPAEKDIFEPNDTAGSDTGGVPASARA